MADNKSHLPFNMSVKVIESTDDKYEEIHLNLDENKEREQYIKEWHDYVSQIPKNLGSHVINFT